MIKKELEDCTTTEVYIVPSPRDIHHIYPIPQPPYPVQKGARIHVLSNPCFLSLNEIRVGIFNSNTVKDICSSLCIKHPDAPPKIDIALQSIIEQRNLYPLYPPTNTDIQDTSIEYEQFRQLMFTETPDLLITPTSDLNYFTKVSICFFELTWYRWLRNVFVWTQALLWSLTLVAPLLLSSLTH
jgi:DNA polymerase II small subunit/DNA polymerase delta subunit B